jgi:hypothetical protein
MASKGCGTSKSMPKKGHMEDKKPPVKSKPIKKKAGK